MYIFVFSPQWDKAAVGFCWGFFTVFPTISHVLHTDRFNFSSSQHIYNFHNLIFFKVNMQIYFPPPFFPFPFLAEMSILVYDGGQIISKIKTTFKSSCILSCFVRHPVSPKYHSQLLSVRKRTAWTQLSWWYSGTL